MQGIGDVAIDGPRFEEFLSSRKGGLARILLLGCTAGLIIIITYKSIIVSLSYFSLKFGSIWLSLQK